MKTKKALSGLILGALLTGCVHVKKDDRQFTITRLGGATSFTGASYEYTNPTTGETQRLVIEGYKSDLQSAFEQGAAAALRVAGKGVGQ